MNTDTVRSLTDIIDAPGAIPRPAIVFQVPGNPAPQGSKRHVGQGVMIESSKFAKPWRAVVSLAASRACQDQGGQRVRPPFNGPVGVQITFTLRRPKAHFGTGRNASALKPGAPMHCPHKPDLDKLARTVLDALTGIIYLDDSQVAGLSLEKVYGDEPGAAVVVERL